MFYTHLSDFTDFNKHWMPKFKHQQYNNLKLNTNLISTLHLAQMGVLSELPACWFIAEVPFVTTPSPAGSCCEGAKGLGPTADGLGELKWTQTA